MRRKMSGKMARKIRREMRSIWRNLIVCILSIDLVIALQLKSFLITRHQVMTSKNRS